MTRTERAHLMLMMVLTFTTGINDAVGYLGLDKVFTGNMTGNVVVLGMALGGAPGLPILGPALALVGFMGGAALSGRILADTETWVRRTTGVFVAVGIGMIVLGSVLICVGHPTHRLGVVITTAAAVLMGMQAIAARHVGIRDMTTVVVTSAIAGLAADSPLGNGSTVAWRRRMGAVALILLGALVGAAVLRWQLGVPLVGAGAIVLLSAAAGDWVSHRPA